MARRVSLSQIRNQLRHAQNKQKQAIDRYNREVQAHNQKRKRAIDDYNRAVRTHNAKVRTNQQRLQQELHKLQNASRNQAPRVTVSARTVHTAFTVLEQRYRSGIAYPEDLYSLFENETANSLRAANAMEGNDVAEPDEIATLQATTLAGELETFAPGLMDRWNGALFSLNPRNPDAARHFCTSARECFVTALDVAAPDEVVERELSTCTRTDDGRLTRRSKLKYLLVRRGVVDDAAEEFVNKDVEDILGLFRLFNDGTHGSAGRFDLNELVAVKERAESGIRFLHKLAQ